MAGRQARVWQCETTPEDTYTFLANSSISEYLQSPLYYNDIEVCNKCNGSYFSLENSIVAEVYIIRILENTLINNKKISPLSTFLNTLENLLYCF